MRKKNTKNMTKKEFAYISSKRIQIFTVFIVFCFGFVVLKTVHLQIVDHIEYKKKLASFQKGNTVIQLSRGRILDRNETVLVENRQSIELVYTPSENMEFNRKQIELFGELVLNGNHKELISRIQSTKEDEIVLMNDLDPQSVSILAEHLYELNRFKYRFVYHRNNREMIFQGVLGSMSDYGLPYEMKDKYLSQGYTMDTSVGISGLEKQYEQILKGDFVCNDDNSGSSGSDLVLTLDIELQKALEEVLINTFKEIENQKERVTMNRISVVISNPKTSDILAMSSIVKKEDKYISDDSDIYTSAYEFGSIVKGAVVYAVLKENVVKKGEKLLDEPLYIKGTPEKSSWKNLGWVDEIDALAYSSNVYMMKAAIRLGNGKYRVNQPLLIDTDCLTKMRDYFNEFGLGMMSGLDVPNETRGFTGSSLNSGHVLDLVIGQYDTYTLIQVLQYINTLATGFKTQPVLVKKIQSNDVSFEPMNSVIHILEDFSALQRVQEGFLACVVFSDGLCHSLKSDAYTIAAKTGTAQSYAQVKRNGTVMTIPSYNNSLVAYAPYENPEVSIACIIPEAYSSENSKRNLCLDITKKMMDIYFEVH